MSGTAPTTVSSADPISYENTCSRQSSRRRNKKREKLMSYMPAAAAECSTRYHKHTNLSPDSKQMDAADIMHSDTASSTKFNQMSRCLIYQSDSLQIAQVHVSTSPNSRILRQCSRPRVINVWYVHVHV